MAQNTFAEIVNNGTFRPRANSKRIREGSDSDFQPPSDIVERAMINWQNVTSTMESLEKKADNMGSDQETAKSLVSKLSPILNDTAELLMLLARKVGGLEKAADSTKATLTKNVVCGNLVNSVETSVAYKKCCEDLKATATQCKIIDLDFGANLKEHGEIVKKAKESLEEIAELKDIIAKAQIIPLAKQTTLRNGKNTIPFIVKTKSKEDRAMVVKEVSKSGLKTPFHWPKSIVDDITKIRVQLSNYKNEKIDLTDKHILIRPNTETGKSLFISYREKDSNKPWIHLQNVKVPADSKLVSQFKQQPCYSEYFKL